MIERISNLTAQIPQSVHLVAVSKMHNVIDIKEVYDAGIKDFAENKVQELLSKQPFLPADIKWHLIGHLQTNKVKYIAPFIHLIHSVDSEKLLSEINSQAKKNNRVIDCLLQIHIAEEETKFGLDYKEAEAILNSPYVGQLSNIRIVGMMGMATFTDDMAQVRAEFRKLKSFFDYASQLDQVKSESFKILSMGMSGDYRIAIEEGSTMVRIGTAIFGERNY